MCFCVLNGVLVLLGSVVRHADGLSHEEGQWLLLLHPLQLLLLLLVVGITANTFAFFITCVVFQGLTHNFVGGRLLLLLAVHGVVGGVVGAEAVARCFLQIVASRQRPRYDSRSRGSAI